jgi:hypothetical protein
MPMAPPSTWANHQDSGPPIGSHPRHHQKGERSYLHMIIQQGKDGVTKAQQDLPVNVAINNQLLDIQSTKGLMGLRTRRLAVDP